MLILFPNKHYLSSYEGLNYRQAKIEPSGPVLKPELEWEFPRTNLYGSVFKSSKGYEMFYQCANALRVGYAVSEDGLSWNKPLVNLADFDADPSDLIHSRIPKNGQKNENKPNKQVPTNLVSACHMPTVVYEPESSKPYKMFSFGEEGYQVSYSLDGLQFQNFSGNPCIDVSVHKNEVTEKNWCSDVAVCFKDFDCYTATVKTYQVDSEDRSRRCIGHASSEDFRTWSEVETIWVPGENEDKIARERGYNWADFYGLCAFLYGDIYLGFLWLFEIDKELPRGTNLGKIEVFLAYSLDGKKWQRVEDKPLIPWDLNFGEEGGMVTTPSAPIFEEGGIKVYYSDSNYDHGFTEQDFEKKIEKPTWVVRCAQLRKERLVGVNSAEGRLDLIETDLTNKRIRLNMECVSGSLTIDFLKNNETICSHVLEGIDDTDYYLAHRLAGFVALRIYLNNATLYAIEIE